MRSESHYVAMQKVGCRISWIFTLKGSGEGIFFRCFKKIGKKRKLIAKVIKGNFVRIVIGELPVRKKIFHFPCGLAKKQFILFAPDGFPKRDHGKGACKKTGMLFGKPVRIFFIIAAKRIPERLG